MNPTNPSEFNFAIQNAIESTFNLIVAQCGEEIKFDWKFTLSESGGGTAAAFVDCDLTNTRGSRYILDRLTNALNAFGYTVKAVGGNGKSFLQITLCDVIQQDASDADYGDFCDREEKQLQNSDRGDWS